jgi:hypothetical protein
MQTYATALSADYSLPYTSAPVKARYASEEITFRQTDKGEGELRCGEKIVKPELRQLLALIDGNTSIDTLAPFFQSHNFAALLSELLALQMIEPIAAIEPDDEPSAYEALNAALRPSQFETARRAAMRATNELLGKLARPYCASLVVCNDVMELCLVLQETLEKVTATGGDAAAAAFLTAIRESIETTCDLHSAQDA